MRYKKRQLFSLSCAVLSMLLLLLGCRENGSEKEFESYMVPIDYLTACAEGGTSETLTYHVESYAVEEKEELASGSLYEDKILHVYLPESYDPGQPYNILYLPIMPL